MEIIVFWVIFNLEWLIFDALLIEMTWDFKNYIFFEKVTLIDM